MASPERPDKQKKGDPNQELLGQKFLIGDKEFQVVKQAIPGVFLEDLSGEESMRRFRTPGGLRNFLWNMGAEPIKPIEPEPTPEPIAEPEPEKELTREHLLEAVASEGSVAYYTKNRLGFLRDVIEQSRKQKNWQSNRVFPTTTDFHIRFLKGDDEFFKNDIIEAFTVCPVGKPPDPPLKMNDIYEGGDDEEAYSILYRANEPNAEKTRIWIDPVNNTSQQLNVEIIVPKSIALEVYEMAEQDPNFAREVVAKALLDRGAVKPEDWFKGIKRRKPETGRTEEEKNYCPIRPPIERWEQLRGVSKMYIVPPDVHGDYKKRGFHSEYVHEFKTKVRKEKGEKKEPADFSDEGEPVLLKPGFERNNYMAKAKPGDRFRVGFGGFNEDVYYHHNVGPHYIFVTRLEDVGKQTQEIDKEKIVVAGSNYDISYFKEREDNPVDINSLVEVEGEEGDSVTAVVESEDDDKLEKVTVKKMETPHEFGSKEEQLKYIQELARPGDKFRITSPGGKINIDAYYVLSAIGHYFVWKEENLKKPFRSLSDDEYISVNDSWKLNPYNKR